MAKTMHLRVLVNLDTAQYSPYPTSRLYPLLPLGTFVSLKIPSIPFSAHHCMGQRRALWMWEVISYANSHVFYHSKHSVAIWNTKFTQAYMLENHKTIDILELATNFIWISLQYGTISLTSQQQICSSFSTQGMSPGRHDLHELWTPPN